VGLRRGTNFLGDKTALMAKAEPLSGRGCGGPKTYLGW